MKKRVFREKRKQRASIPEVVVKEVPKKKKSEK
jgi:hypothetical protein